MKFAIVLVIIEKLCRCGNVVKVSIEILVEYWGKKSSELLQNHQFMGKRIENICIG